MEHLLNPAKAFKEDTYKQMARIGKSLSSDKRLEILNLLSQGPKSVEKLANATEMNIPNVSRHLQILNDAKLVKSVKKGTYVFYSLADPSIIDFMSSLWRISEKQLPDISKIKDEFLNHLDDIQTLTMDEVIEKLNQDEITFIDVRPADEYEAGHIPGAVSVPMDDLEQFMAKMPQGVEIIAYCRGPLCVMSALAAEKFKAHGFKAYRLEEGVHEWEGHFQIRH